MNSETTYHAYVKSLIASMVEALEEGATASSLSQLLLLEEEISNVLTRANSPLLRTHDAQTNEKLTNEKLTNDLITNLQSLSVVITLSREVVEKKLHLQPSTIVLNLLDLIHQVKTDGLNLANLLTQIPNRTKLQEAHESLQELEKKISDLFGFLDEQGDLTWLLPEVWNNQKVARELITLRKISGTIRETITVLEQPTKSVASRAYLRGRTIRVDVTSDILDEEEEELIIDDLTDLLGRKKTPHNVFSVREALLDELE